MHSIHQRFLLLFVPATALAVLVLCSCQTTTQSTPSIREVAGPQAITFGVDARDYNDISSALAQSILASPKLTANKRKVLALGPIDDGHCNFQLDARKLQEKIQTILLRSHHFDVSYAVDALKRKSAPVARYAIMQAQWEQKNTVDPESLRVFGSLAKVDYLLFGRITTQTTTKGDTTEVTYTYNWKIGDCQTGLLVWADETEKTKMGPRINGHFDPRRSKIPLLVAPMAFTPRSAEQYPELVKKWKKRGYGNAVWQTIEDKLYDAAIFELVTVPPTYLNNVQRCLNSAGSPAIDPNAARAMSIFPSKILVSNMNFFEMSTESLNFGKLVQSKEYHVELFLRYYQLDGTYLNVPVPAKGEARNTDLLVATSQATDQALAKLLRRLRLAPPTTRR